MWFFGKRSLISFIRATLSQRWSQMLGVRKIGSGAQIPNVLHIPSNFLKIYTSKIMFIATGLGNMSINNFNRKFSQEVISCLERIQINSG